MPLSSLSTRLPRANKRAIKPRNDRSPGHTLAIDSRTMDGEATFDLSKSPSSSRPRIRVSGFTYVQLVAWKRDETAKRTIACKTFVIIRTGFTRNAFLEKSGEKRVNMWYIYIYFFDFPRKTLVTGGRNTWIANGVKLESNDARGELSGIHYAWHRRKFRGMMSAAKWRARTRCERDKRWSKRSVGRQGFASINAPPKFSRS